MQVYLIAVMSVLMSAAAQVLLKLGVSAPACREALSGDASPLGKLLVMMVQPQVLGGLALYGISAVIWLAVLARLDLSKAYPFVGLGFIGTMVAGAFLLGERVDTLRVVGTLLVASGVVLVARS